MENYPTESSAQTYQNKLEERKTKSFLTQSEIISCIEFTHLFTPSDRVVSQITHFKQFHY